MSSSTGPPILELALFKPGVPKEDFIRGISAVLSTLHTVVGVRRSAYAFEHETSANARFFIDWASDKDHEVFKESDTYNTFVQSLVKLLNCPPTILFADLRPLGLPIDVSQSTVNGDSDEVLQPGKSTTTEVVTIFFPPDISSDMQTLCEGNMGQFMRTMKSRKLDGLTGILHGWALHETPAPTSEAMSKAYIMLFGWTAIERHTEFTKGDVFKEIWPLFQEVYDKGKALEMEMYHVRDLVITEGEPSRAATA